MPALKLIEAIKNGDIETVDDLIKTSEAIEQKDEYGWTALNWAAAKGDTSIIEKLLMAGANIANVGRDKRTAYQIALAAAHIECAHVLGKAEEKASVNQTKLPRPYCKAYAIAELRQFSAWHESPADLTDDAIVFVHQDLTVTRSMFHSKDVVFDKISPAWESFCKNQLAFSVPSDLDLVELYAANRSTNTKQSVS